MRNDVFPLDNYVLSAFLVIKIKKLQSFALLEPLNYIITYTILPHFSLPSKCAGCSPFVLMPDKEVPLLFDNEQRQQTPKNSQSLSFIVTILLLYFFSFIPLLSLSELYILLKNIENIRVIGI